MPWLIWSFVSLLSLNIALFSDVCLRCCLWAGLSASLSVPCLCFVCVCLCAFVCVSVSLFCACLYLSVSVCGCLCFWFEKYTFTLTTGELESPFSRTFNHMRRLEGAARARPPIVENRSCIYHLLYHILPPILGLPLLIYFWQVYASAFKESEFLLEIYSRPSYLHISRLCQLF